MHQTSHEPCFVLNRGFLGESYICAVYDSAMCGSKENKKQPSCADYIAMKSGLYLSDHTPISIEIELYSAWKGRDKSYKVILNC